jgi:hypothetical protein
MIGTIAVVVSVKGLPDVTEPVGMPAPARSEMEKPRSAGPCAADGVSPEGAVPVAVAVVVGVEVEVEVEVVFVFVFVFVFGVGVAVASGGAGGAPPPGKLSGDVVGGAG